MAAGAGTPGPGPAAITIDDDDSDDADVGPEDKEAADLQELKRIFDTPLFDIPADTAADTAAADA